MRKKTVPYALDLTQGHLPSGFLSAGWPTGHSRVALRPMCHANAAQFPPDPSAGAVWWYRCAHGMHFIVHAGARRCGGMRPAPRRMRRTRWPQPNANPQACGKGPAAGGRLGCGTTRTGRGRGHRAGACLRIHCHGHGQCARDRQGAHGALDHRPPFSAGRRRRPLNTDRGRGAGISRQVPARCQPGVLDAADPGKAED